MNSMLQKKLRVLVIGESATLAHVVRPLTIALALVENGFDVTFAADEYFSSAFANAPLTIAKLPSRSPQEFRRIVSTNEILFPADLLRSYIDSDLALIESVGPDVILHDFRRSLTVSAVAARIPLLTLTNSYWSPYLINRAFPAPYSDAIAEQARSDSSAAQNSVILAEREFNQILPNVFRAQAEGLDIVRTEWGLNPFPDYLTGATWGDRVLYADLPSVVALERIPANHRFLGPVTWEPSIGLPDWWSKIPESAPLVYVSVGSSGPAELAERVADISSRFDCYFVISSGANLSSLKMSSRCFVAESLPGGVVAQRASLMITNGGSPSAYQALAAGVPVLGVPLNIDQLLCMQHLVRTGAARCIRADCLTAENLAETVSSMLTLPSYRVAAESLRQQCAQYDFSSEISSIITEVTKGSERLAENG